jgi:hypothetical protein
MKKYFDLSSIKLGDCGQVEGLTDELRQLEAFEVRSVSGGNNYTYWCDGSSPANGACNNYTGCSAETNTGGCNNMAYCSDGSNGDCYNAACGGSSNASYCSNGFRCTPQPGPATNNPC